MTENNVITRTLARTYHPRKPLYWEIAGAISTPLLHIYEQLKHLELEYLKVEHPHRDLKPPAEALQRITQREHMNAAWDTGTRESILLSSLHCFQFLKWAHDITHSTAICTADAYNEDLIMFSGVAEALAEHEALVRGYISHEYNYRVLARAVVLEELKRILGVRLFTIHIVTPTYIMGHKRDFEFDELLRGCTEEQQGALIAMCVPQESTLGVPHGLMHLSILGASKTQYIAHNDLIRKQKHFNWRAALCLVDFKPQRRYGLYPLHADY